MTLFNKKSSYDAAQATRDFDAYLTKVQKKLKHRDALQVLISSPQRGIEYQYPAQSGDKPFHIASIGKVFTAVLIELLAERGIFTIDDQLIKYLPSTDLAKLFVFEGKDYADEVTIRQLLGHTSGVADYFEDPVIAGTPFLKRIISQPETRWTPDLLLDFTRTQQRTFAPPGRIFHYSDTGYILLGRLIERMTGKAFHEHLHDEFFIPLGMEDSYLAFYSEPAKQPRKPLQPLYVNGTDVSRFESLSADWSGGGIVSTTSDLLQFQRGLRNWRLIRAETLRSMEVFDHKFRTGLHYGLGMMQVHFGEFFFLLKKWPKLTGHIGITATHMFYDETSDTHLIMNFGSTSNMVASFRVLIDLIGKLNKIKG
jgi:D-alanyl-D-alanine carboxypeptidase